jgi:hypothetical protein
MYLMYLMYLMYHEYHYYHALFFGIQKKLCVEKKV